MKKRTITLIILALAVIGGGSAYWFLVRESGQPVSQESSQSDPEPTVNGTRIRLIATGDTIAHDSINQAAKQADGSYNYRPLLEEMKPYFDSADIRFCNQATMAGGENFGISGYPVFNAPLAFTHGMVELGCNLVNIGTNHTNDKGQKLIDAAVAEWDKQDILAFAGANRSVAEQQRVRTFEVKGVKFAFLSYSTYSNNRQLTPHGLNMYERAVAKRQVEAAKQAADVVIVSMRWGTEYSPGINAQQETIAQDLADFGADIIFGHGPHVLEPVKRLKGASGNETLVWFSLGNFLNSQIDIASLVNGVAVMDVDVQTKKITDVSFMPVYQHYEWTPAQKASEDLMSRRGFRLLPLDKASELLNKSLHDTTADQQKSRIKSVLNRFTEVPIITSAEY